MTTNKPLPIRAILRSIEVSGTIGDGLRSNYFVKLSVAGKVVVKSTDPKPHSPVLKWEWNDGHEILFEPSSMIKVVLYRGFGTNIDLLNRFVVQYEGKVEDLLDNNSSFSLTNKKGNSVPAKMKIALSPTQINDYQAIGGPSDQQVETLGSVVYEGLKTVMQGLYDCSDMFLPLKTAAGGILTIINLVETVSDNKKELEDLNTKIRAITSIVKMYKEKGGLGAINHRIDNFCEAIIGQLQTVEKLQTQSQPTRTALAKKNADTILKALRDINSLCDIFQMDTQLHTDVTVGEIAEHQRSSEIDGLIKELNPNATSYKTRESSYGAPTGCLGGTRVKVLEELEAWASNADSSKVYWMAGMAGIGKSTIAHTFCQRLEAKNMLCGSFFASRASEETSNGRLIIPVIAHALARASPPIADKIVKAIKDDDTLAKSTYSNMREQFKQLVYDPIRTTAGMVDKPYKVVVIDAVDECSNLEVVASFIKLVLQSASKIPLKVFISSREEFDIIEAFNSEDTKARNFYLHDIEKDVVQGDIRKYLETSLADIRDNRRGTAEKWPSPTELKELTARSGKLFIYAATAIRYIRDGKGLYEHRLSEMASQGLESVDEFQTNLDVLYLHILGQAGRGKRKHEAAAIRDLVTIIIFLRNPLPMEDINSLWKKDDAEADAHSYLSSLSSVIHIPNQPKAVVAPFHASFPDFVKDSKRCSPERCPLFPSLVASEGHGLLALRCLKQMNRSLKYNICELPEELTLLRRETTNSLENVGKISEALKYACIYWAAHLAKVEEFGTELVNALRDFLHKHLLHWMECLSILGELQTGVKSLGSIVPVLSTFKVDDLHLLVDDARRCLQMNFEVVQKYCMEIYQSALVWLPRKSLIRETYVKDSPRAPKVNLGLPDSWGPTEFILQNGSWVTSVAFSQDGSRVVSGSHDETVRIWNVTTGKVEAELEGHTTWVTSVAFSQDGSRVVSGSHDETVRIWNVTTGKVEAELEGHTNWVTSIAFSQDGSRVVSGSDDETVRIWNVTTGEVEAELKGHTDLVMSIAFSQDGSRVVSGSHDETVRIWNVTTGTSSSMTSSNTTLPDGSCVNRLSPGSFFISYPSQQLMLSMDSAPHFSDDGQWVMSTLRDCWIPSQYRNFGCSSILAGRICLGYPSGNVVIVDITTAL